MPWVVGSLLSDEKKRPFARRKVQKMTIEQHVHQNSERFIAELQECCRFSSISATSDPDLTNNRDWLAERLRKLGAKVEVWKVDGDHDALFGRLEGRGPQTLLFYCHYDVQPPEPIDLWHSPPFSAEIRKGKIFARGVCDDKSDVMARLHALETWLAVEGSLPFNVLFLCEGEEEIGSRSFPNLVHEHAAALKADGCLWESGGFTSSGRPELSAGTRGALYVELRVRLLAHDVHSGYASIYRSAPAILVEGLALLKDREGHILIPGFYDAAIDPTEEDLELILQSPDNDAERLQSAGADRFLGNDRHPDVVRRMLFAPTANIDGISTGYAGPGPKAIIPAEAMAKVDFRLIPKQDPEDILDKLKAWFHHNHLDEITVTPLAKIPPARSPVNTPVMQAALECAKRLHGEPVLMPFSAGTGPLFPVANDLGIPTASAPGCHRPDSAIHSPNENISTDDYIKCVMFNALVLESLRDRWTAK
jgi:acetylornithine deacetylase/succinyl-diaminopimelate desuccinylase-like protein